MRLTLLLLLTSFGLFAQEDFTTTTSLFGELRARQIGPAVMSGRISCLAVHPTDAATVYIGAAGGGVWKTSSAGANLAPIFDEYTQSIGAIALAPSDPDIVYVGTGEPWPRNSVSVGTGMYRSVDGGNRWESLGLEGTERIAAVAVHPGNPDIVYVAALGPLWSSGEERGVFKTTDGGKSWVKVLYLDENTGAANLSLDPNNPEVLYAAMWSFRRTPYSFDSGLNGKSGLYKSADGGENWTELRNGFPEGKLGRIGVAIAPSNSDTVYASVETGNTSTSGMYLSGDAGATWTHRSSALNTRIRPFYFSELTVDPSDASIVAKCGREGIISRDAGNRWSNFDGFVHSDFHAIWIDPADGKHILVGTDGGVYESRDRGNTFKMWMNLPVSQFYHVSVDNAKPYRVYGGLQDNGSWFAPNRSSGGISNADWEKTYGGDGFYSFRHPTKDNYVFSEFQGGNLVRYDTETGVAKNIAPYATADTDPLRFNWNTPIHLSQDGKRTYFASQYLFLSNDEGDSWERISPDLTTNDKSKQQQATSGGLTIDNSTAENYTTIYAVAESPIDNNTIWVGTDDGNLQVTTDAGKSWTKLNDNFPADLPKGAWITFVEPSPHDAGTAFVTFDDHRTGNMDTYLYKTADGGKTWTRLGGEDLDGYALSVRQDLVNPNLVFLGTEFGLYLSLDGGSSWAPFRNNLPMVGIRDMVIHPRESDLVLGTHGRGVIIIDDLEALRQITPEITTQKIAFLKSRPAFLPDPSGFGNGNFGGSGNYVGSNPTTSAEIMYYAGSRHTFGKMYIEVYKDGEKIRELPAGKSKGLNIIRMPTTLERPKAAPSDNRNALIGGSQPPQLAPGTYQVKLVKGKDTYETEFTITTDPTSPYTAADRAVQRKAVMKLFDDTEELAYIYEVLDQVQQQASSIKQKSTKKRITEMASSIKDMAGKEKSRLAFKGGDFYVNEGSMLREEMGNLYFSVSSFPGRPSDSQLQEAERIHRELVAARSKLDFFLANDVAKLNDKLGEEEQITWPAKEAFLAAEEDVSGM
ncbi:WD40/YVTN/BNR-like repeat-containing protein [Neolewinella persica]|uniref:WD40/YVTN/BNR-like repeat-containing protein n=1 Tax=Neolewinella persica TaxID=70998 RepID=UPI000368B11C|nr:hypothetical protein [Neolewinella persica]